MKGTWLSLIFLMLATSDRHSSPARAADAHATTSHQTYLGFDRNKYPGDANLAALRRYQARWFVLGPERYGGLDGIYRDKGLQTKGTELHLAAELDGGVQVYRVINNDK